MVVRRQIGFIINIRKKTNIRVRGSISGKKRIFEGGDRFRVRESRGDGGKEDKTPDIRGRFRVRESGGGDVTVLDELDETPPFSRRKHFLGHFTNAVDHIRFTSKKLNVIVQNKRKTFYDNHGTVGGGQTTVFTFGAGLRLYGFVLEDQITPE